MTLAEVQNPLIARSNNKTLYGFKYFDHDFTQESFNIFCGLNTVDNPDNVTDIFRTLKQHNLSCTRMGAFKPRTSPYSFQGLGANCLSYVFELAAEYSIKIIAMEITHESQIELVDRAASRYGDKTGVFLQIGTRNAQNFELLKAVGSQKKYPILYKRGFGITLQESLSACEYLAHAGNDKIIFCLRGMKSNYGDPHRNFVDFAHVPVIKRLTKMSVCIDPSHSVGSLDTDPNGISDVFHVSAQGIISGANMLLVDVHPDPKQALVDAGQTLPLENLNWFLEDIKISRDAYLKRLSLLKSNY